MTNVYGNDRLGDCTAAGAGHIIGALARQRPQRRSRADRRSRSSPSTRSRPATIPPTLNSDQGGDEVTVLNDWRDKGFFADGSGKILGWANVDGANIQRVKQAIWLFENVYFGVELPDAWISPFPQANGFTWDVAGDANPAHGHCFAGLGYNDNGVIVNSWGMMGTVTWAAVAKYATTPGQGELHVAFSEDAIERASARAPNGFDVAALTADLKAMAFSSYELET